VALLERLAILITADAAGAISEMKKVAASAEKDLGKAGTEGSKLSANMTKVGAAMVGAGAGLLAVGVASADTATSLGREVMKLQRYTGMTAEEASKLAFAAKMSGVPVDSLGTGLGKLSKAMEANNPAFEKLGVNVRDSNGKLRNLGDVLPDLAEKFKNMPNGPEKTAEALQLFGRSGMDLMPFLNKGKEGIAELSKEAEKMGLVLSQDNIGQIKAHITSQRELGAALDGVKTQIGLSMIPVLDTMTNAFKNIPTPVYDVIGPLTVFGGLGLTAAGGISLIVGQLKNLASIAKGAYEGASTLMTKIMAMPAAFGLAAVGVAVIAGAFLLLRNHLDDVAASSKKAQGDLSAFTVDELNQKITDVNKEMEKVAPVSKEWILGLGEALTRMVSGDDERYAKLQGTKKALEEALDAANNSVGPTRTLAEAEKAAADETSNHAVAVKTLNDILNASLDPFLNSITATEKVAESERKLTESKQKVFFAQLGLTDAITKYGQESPQAKIATDELAEAQRGLDSAQAASFDSAIKYEQSIGTLKAQMQDHPEIYQQNIDKINEMEKSHKIDTETAERMRVKLTAVATAAGLIPAKTGVTVSADTDEAQNRLNSIRDTIHDILNLPTPRGTFGNGVGVLTRAMGGRVGPGMAMGGRPSQPVLVGELGPEIFLPDTAGTIVTAEKTKQMLSSSGDSGTSITNVTINMPPGSNGSDVVNAIKRYEKTNGTSWRN